jgi:hypothetical protein
LKLVPRWLGTMGSDDVAWGGYRNGWAHSRIKIMRKLDPELRGGELEGPTQDPLAPRTPQLPGQQALLPRNKLGVYSPHENALH